eukprot:NODE_41_length_34096_cov_2.002235.p16 type:complete len:257 gc:universal NODE_41_length_34096_cov_2.002235:28323-27553(-)
MCKNFDLIEFSQFNKKTPYFQYASDVSFYFNFCDQDINLRPCENYICKSSDGVNFDGIGNDLKLDGNVATFLGGDCENSNAATTIELSCGNVFFSPKGKIQKCSFDALYQHPYFCPKLKETCAVRFQGYTVDVKDVEFSDDQDKFNFKCQNFFGTASRDNCDYNSICVNSKIGLENPYIREIDSDKIVYRFLYQSQQYELELNCNSNGNREIIGQPLFTGGPNVRRIILNNGTCPTLLTGPPITLLIILAMYFIFI